MCLKRITVITKTSHIPKPFIPLAVDHLQHGEGGLGSDTMWFTALVLCCHIFKLWRQLVLHSVLDTRWPTCTNFQQQLL